MTRKKLVDAKLIDAMLEEAKQFADEFQSMTEPPRPWQVSETNVNRLADVDEEMLRLLKEAGFSGATSGTAYQHRMKRAFENLAERGGAIKNSAIAPRHPAFFFELATLLNLDHAAARDWLIAKVGAFRCISDSEAAALIDEVLG